MSRLLGYIHVFDRELPPQLLGGGLIVASAES